MLACLLLQQMIALHGAMYNIIATRTLRLLSVQVPVRRRENSKCSEIYIELKSILLTCAMCSSIAGTVAVVIRDATKAPGGASGGRSHVLHVLLLPFELLREAQSLRDSKQLRGAGHAYSPRWLRVSHTRGTRSIPR